MWADRNVLVLFMCFHVVKGGGSRIPPVYSVLLIVALLIITLFALVCYKICCKNKSVGKKLHRRQTPSSETTIATNNSGTSNMDNSATVVLHIGERSTENTHSQRNGNCPPSPPPSYEVAMFGSDWNG